MDDSKDAALKARFAAAREPVESVDAGALDAVPFLYAGRTLNVRILTEELTHICPMTGLPDFATLDVEYEPDERIVELKSLKYYLLQYRQVGIFYEHIVFRILDDLVGAIAPRTMTVRYQGRARGGVSSTVSASWPEP